MHPIATGSADDIPPYREAGRRERLGGAAGAAPAPARTRSATTTTEESTMPSFSIGDGVRATGGPMQHQYGTVVYLREDDGTILVRFGGSQQLYFREDELEPWA